MREVTENALVIKSLDKKSLAETGIQNCDVAVVCIGEHIETSILTTLHLVSLGVPKVVAKATSAEHGEILEKLGAEVVYPGEGYGHPSWPTVWRPPEFWTTSSSAKRSIFPSFRFRKS